jgi:hypothetical protein
MGIMAAAFRRHQSCQPSLRPNFVQLGSPTRLRFSITASNGCGKIDW